MIACFIFAGLIGIGALTLAVLWALDKIDAARERKAMRIRDAALKRFGMSGFPGTKDRHLS